MTQAEEIIKKWYWDSPWATEYWDVEEDLAGLTELAFLIAERTREECEKNLTNFKHPEHQKRYDERWLKVYQTIIRKYIRSAKWEDEEI